jgi:hypothetical protein
MGSMSEAKATVFDQISMTTLTAIIHLGLFLEFFGFRVEQSTLKTYKLISYKTTALSCAKGARGNPRELWCIFGKLDS